MWSLIQKVVLSGILKNGFPESEPGQVKVSGSVRHTHPIFLERPPGFFCRILYTNRGSWHCARRSLRRPWKLELRIVTWSKPRMFCEESVGKIKFKVFTSVHEFYRLKALITLEQVNTTEWSGKKRRIFISKTAMVGCCKLSLYLVMSMLFTFGDDWNDVPCKSLFWSLAMM